MNGGEIPDFIGFLRVLRLLDEKHILSYARHICSNFATMCSGAYRIDPYYPTLSLMTVSVRCDSVSVPDGTQLYVTVNGAGGTLYPFTSNVIAIASQTGTCTYSVYITPGTTITSVLITDASGAVISAGN